jgi:FG-GAP-like repeat
LADLDGDGRQDLVSGDFFGQVHWFARRPEGGFQAAELLRLSNDEILDAGDASTPLPVDVDGDGTLDLLIGNMAGDLVWARGVPALPSGSPDPVQQATLADQNACAPEDEPDPSGPLAAARFEVPVALLAAGEPIRVERGDAAPGVADWDRDGDLDLVLGAQDGSVVWFQNLGSTGLLQLGPAVELISPLEWGQRGEGRPDKRVKPALFDWNHDGWLDLVLGDYTVVAGPDTDPAVEAEARARQAAAELLLEPWNKRQEALAEGLLQRWRESGAPGGESDPARLHVLAYQRAMQLVEQDADYRAAMGMHLDALEHYALVDTRFEERGYLWVYLRLPAADPR